MLVGPNSDPLWRQTAVEANKELPDTNRRPFILGSMRDIKALADLEASLALSISHYLYPCRRGGQKVSTCFM
jgi:hypothetical protein